MRRVAAGCTAARVAAALAGQGNRHGRVGRQVAAVWWRRRSAGAILLPELGPPVLEPNLNSCLGQLDARRQLLSVCNQVGRSVGRSVGRLIGWMEGWSQVNCVVRY